MSMSSKNVKFSKDSDTSESRTSSHVSSHASSHASHKSSRGHRRSDSESLSDYDSRGSVPEGAFSSSDYAQQQLRKSLHSACAERDRWKAKAEELDEHLNHTKKEFNQLEARWRGIIERNEVIEAEKKKLLSDKKALQQDKNDLLDENAKLQEKLDRLEKKLNRASGPPPSSSVPVRDNADKANAKIHRSNSRSQRDAPRERALSEAEQAEKDKARWSKRFERSDESSDGRSDGTSKTERRRRRESTTYIEPMGPPAARPAAPVPPSPTRHFPTYTTSPAYAPQYASVREPVMSSVPRTVKSPSKHPPVIHPRVLVQSPRYDESPFHPDEDGGYFPHPLPRGPR